MSVELSDPEDIKLVTLARNSRARAKAHEGAALRDADGRTYSAASIDLPSITMSALKVAVASAVSSGVSGAEAVVVVTEDASVSDSDVEVLRDFAGAGVPIYRADPRGDVLDLTKT